VRSGAPILPDSDPVATRRPAPGRIGVVSGADDIKRSADARAAKGQVPRLERFPRRKLLIVSCMDSRIDLFEICGLENGDAHLLRNAGGVVTDDMIRSISISQRKLGTREIVLIHHTDCGMQTITEEGFKSDLEDATGQRPTWSIESFRDPEQSVRISMARIRSSPFVLESGQLRGFVYDVDSGELNEVK
jgi:carbonic anhydrase